MATKIVLIGAGRVFARMLLSAADACVVVPWVTDGLGVHPLAFKPLPRRLAAYVHPAVDAQAVTVEAALSRDRQGVTTP